MASLTIKFSRAKGNDKQEIFCLQFVGLVEEEGQLKPKEEVTTLEEETVIHAVTTIQAAFRGMKVKIILLTLLMPDQCQCASSEDIDKASESLYKQGSVQCNLGYITPQ